MNHGLTLILSFFFLCSDSFQGIWGGGFRYLYSEVKVKSFSRVRLFATPWTVAYHTPPSVGFSKQEYWSGVPFPFPGHLPNPEIENRTGEKSPALACWVYGRLNLWQVKSLPLSYLGSPWISVTRKIVPQPFLSKTSNKSTIWPSNLTTRHMLWENHNSKRHLYPSVHCSIIYSSQDTEAT